MARVYLDANYFIDLIEERRMLEKDKLVENKLFLSPLSIHIYVYLYKKKIPDQKLLEFQELVNIVLIDKLITDKSIVGPTTDFEDNLQLHSAVAVECDYFLTTDRHLLGLGFFGNLRIANSL